MFARRIGQGLLNRRPLRPYARFGAFADVAQRHLGDVQLVRVLTPQKAKVFRQRHQPGTLRGGMGDQTPRRLEVAHHVRRGHHLQRGDLHSQDSSAWHRLEVKRFIVPR